MLASRDNVKIIPVLVTSLSASGVLTSDNINVADGDTVTINGTVYTFKTTLTSGNANAYEVLIGGTADLSLTNLASAINNTGTPGTDYDSSTPINPDVSSGAVASHAITVTAKAAGATQNTYATTETSAHLSWGSATLKGGAGGPTTNITLNTAATFTTEMWHVGTFSELIAFLNSQAHSGTTPTLDIKFQISPDKLNWVDVGDAITQVTTTDSVTFKRLTANFGKYMRAIIVLAGTAPSYKFDLSLVGKA